MQKFIVMFLFFSFLLFSGCNDNSTNSPNLNTQQKAKPEQPSTDGTYTVSLTISLYQLGTVIGDCPGGSTLVKTFSADFHCSGSTCYECSSKFKTFAQEFMIGNCTYNTTGWSVVVSGEWDDLTGTSGPTMRWAVSSADCEQNGVFNHAVECSPITGGSYSNSFTITSLDVATSWYKLRLALDSFQEDKLSK